MPKNNTIEKIYLTSINESEKKNFCLNYLTHDFFKNYKVNYFFNK